MRKIKHTIIASTLAMILLPSISLAKDAPDANQKQMPAPKADIYVIPKAQNIPVDLKYPAQIESFQNINVVSRVLGILQTKHFTEGQKVKKGDLLYEIEDDIYAAMVDAAKASVKMNEATLQKVTRNWNRIKELYLKKAVSTQTKDEALSSYEEASAALLLAKAQLHQAQINLDHTKVKAPISGTTGLKKVDIGSLVSATPATELIQITHNDVVFASFSMPLTDFANFKHKIWLMPENNKVKLSVEVDNKLTDISGEIDFIDVNVDKNTATVKIRAKIDNSEGFLMPGSFVRVALHGITEKNVITIPQKAVLQNPLGTIVMIEKDGVVGVKPVTLAKESGDYFIIRDGPLQSGDRVIVNNFFRLKPGANVEVDKIINQEGN
ncbi:MAG: efflux RND transporter periplasmic adaptor subunit [Sulfurimonas sp.]|uniref:efflux RND transporter periplasmic adaptor subunit n=1 Tax=Sulfurimonas sp. TaxID=2022749 RepID=UPI0025D668E9|nr:efflux RND transporter periplasmic adaptor subunit [Sulfurimonas sp.]MCK9490970.1 efflux RND transporter periplasmic adaptor subunit [Sulfurimonas sp.]